MEEDIYKENGYKDRQDYLKYLCAQYRLDMYTVSNIAEMYGEAEDFNGLVSALEDLPILLNP